VNELRSIIDDALRRLSSKFNIAKTLNYGRKNWIFAGSKAVGERGTIIYPVIEIAKLNGIAPQPDIADIIEEIADDWPAVRWGKLLPRGWRTSQSGATLPG
jgi:hypothetical protein